MLQVLRSSIQRPSPLAFTVARPTGHPIMAAPPRPAAGPFEPRGAETRVVSGVGFVLLCFEPLWIHRIPSNQEI